MRSYGITLPCTINTIKCATKSRTRTAAQAFSCSLVNVVISSLRPFVAASEASRAACAADSPVTGGAVLRVQHQIDVFSTAMGVAMSMDHSFAAVEWKPKASAGKCSQVEEMGPESPPTLLDEFVLIRATFNGALNESVRRSGKEDQEIADKIHISAGYMSRFMRGVGQQWAKRLVAFMHVTNSRAPLQWIAHQVGCEVVPKDRRAVEVATLRARLQELEGA